MNDQHGFSDFLAWQKELSCKIEWIISQPASLLDLFPKQVPLSCSDGFSPPGTRMIKPESGHHVGLSILDFGHEMDNVSFPKTNRLSNPS